MNNKLKNQHGISLVETIAAVALLGLIFLSFYTLFVSSQKVSVASEDIVDSTMVAQQVMEELYHQSSQKSINETLDYYVEEKNATSSINTNTYFIKYDYPISNVSVEILFTKKTSTLTTLYNTQIFVYEGRQLKATLENIFNIKD